MTTTAIPVFDCQVRDGNRLLTFDGKLLASVSSRDSDRDRWTEMRIYQTTGGSYILEKIGRSIRLHMPGCSDILKDLPLFQQPARGRGSLLGHHLHRPRSDHRRSLAQARQLHTLTSYQRAVAHRPLCGRPCVRGLAYRASLVAPLQAVPGRGSMVVLTTKD
jgi:hypothetical protein